MDTGIMVIEDVREMQALSTRLRAGGKKIALVPTMGFLHAGHGELLKAGRKKGDVLVLSIFVNPTQFGPKEDFKAYPRDMERDARVAKEAGVDIIFAPRPEGMYPQGYRTFVEVEGLSERLCGASRPGHFRGVATVVLKLFNIVKPHHALFGMKDYQQLLIIRRMAEDLDLDTEITGIDTVREEGGLAMSSRNSYLDKEERAAALVIPRSLDAARSEFLRGERKVAVIIDKMKKIIENEPRAVIDYVKVCDKDSLEDLEEIKDTALVAIAVKIGRARLIDNTVL